MSWTLDCSTPKARKDHRCIWCGETIPKGDKYSRWVGIFEGDFHCNQMHLECAEVSSEDAEDGFDAFSNERPK